VLAAATAALPLRIVADALNSPAASGTNSPGVEDPKNFHAITAGTSIEFSFPEPVLAFGLIIITPEDPRDPLQRFADFLECRRRLDRHDEYAWPLDIGFTYMRRPPDPCCLRGVTGPVGFDVIFEELWSRDEAFANRQVVETIDLEGMILKASTLRIESGEIKEEVVLYIPEAIFQNFQGTQTLRSFDETTGAETASQDFQI
jgi:hypothetical protein